jgi:hypothetical protein
MADAVLICLDGTGRKVLMISYPVEVKVDSISDFPLMVVPTPDALIALLL